MTIVAIGCSADPDYSFLLPLTCALWERVVGFVPVALIVGTNEEWTKPKSRVVLEYLDAVREYIDPAAGFPTHTTAQNVRQHAAALKGIDDDAWVMPGDADLWPLQADFYQQHEGTEHKAVCYYSNGDHFNSKEDVLERAARGLGAQTIPTCHVAMKAKTWREVYGLIEGDVRGSIEKTLNEWHPKRSPDQDQGMALWMSDQQVMTEKLCQQDWFPSQALMVQRIGHPPIDRLDRMSASWNGLDPHDYVDAHIYRDPAGARWEDLIRVFETILPDLGPWAREYHAKYMEAT